MANNTDYKLSFDRLEPIIMLLPGGRPVDGIQLFYTIEGIGSYSVQVEKSKFTPEGIRELARSEAEQIIKTLKG